MIKMIDKRNISECVRVIRQSFLTVANEFGFTPKNAPRFTAFATTEDRLLYQLEQERRPMYAYFDDLGRIIGYYSLTYQAENKCELNNLCVLPQYRHHRIGETLLNDAFIKAREAGFTKMTIGIVEENHVLRKWYEKFGFTHIGAKRFDFFPFTCGYMERTL